MTCPFRLERVDLPLLLGVALGIAAMLAFLELLRRVFRFHDEVSRKTVHLGTGVLIFLAPFLDARTETVLILSLAFTLVNATACRFRWLKAVHRVTRSSYGTAYYPLAMFVLALLFWDAAPSLAIAGMAVLALGDGFAGIVGELLPSPRMYRVTGDGKSAEGSVVMFAASCAALAATVAVHGLPAGTPFEAGLASPTVLLLLAAVALFATAWEAASSRGMDNLTVPVMTGCALAVALRSESAAQLFLQGTLLAAMAALVSLRLRFLRFSGAVAVFLLAVTVHGLGGWMWTLPILVFFVPSSLLSAWKKSRKQAFEQMFEKSSARDVWQVAANGGVAGALLLASLAWPNPLWYPLYVASLAAAAADTWATELGVLSRGEPRLLRSFERSPRGTSGAVSVTGLLASVAGAATVACSSLPFLPGVSVRVVLPMAAAMAASGVAGALVDSLLGATLQASFRCAVCRARTEKRSHCGRSAARVAGVDWMGNDAVNAACTASGALFMLIFYGILA